jgi:DNA-binding NarL/FixJ family response regulator
MSNLRILIADDHEIVRQGLRSLLQTRPGWEVCGEAADGWEAVSKAAELHPDIVAMDVGMPNLNGVDAARQILKNAPIKKFCF